MPTRDLYFNHAGTSWPKPAVVEAAAKNAMSAAPTTWLERFNAAHQAIASYFGINQLDQLLFTPGCTAALAVGIADLQIPSGQCVLTSPWEHHALYRPLLKMQASGIALEHIPHRSGESDQTTPCTIDLDWLEQRLTRRDVGLVAITAACNVTGELLPFEDVISLARQYGATVVLDAAQVVGWLQLDLPRLGADLVAFGGHKGLQSPWGIGGLYLSADTPMKCTSAACELPKKSGGQSKAERPGYCDVGSVDQVALAGLHAAVEYLKELDTDSTLETARHQIWRLRRTLEPIDGVRIHGPTQPDKGMPTLAFGIDDQPSGDIASRLKQHGLVVGSGIQCAAVAHKTLGTQSTGLVRLSVGVGQPDDQIDEAIERIQAVL